MDTVSQRRGDSVTRDLGAAAGLRCRQFCGIGTCVAEIASAGVVCK